MTSTALRYHLAPHRSHSKNNYSQRFRAQNHSRTSLSSRTAVLNPSDGEILASFGARIRLLLAVVRPEGAVQDVDGREVEGRIEEVRLVGEAEFIDNALRQRPAYDLLARYMEGADVGSGKTPARLTSPSTVTRREGGGRSATIRQNSKAASQGAGNQNVDLNKLRIFIHPTKRPSRTDLVRGLQSHNSWLA